MTYEIDFENSNFKYLVLCQFTKYSNILEAQGQNIGIFDIAYLSDRTAGALQMFQLQLHTTKSKVPRETLEDHHQNRLLDHQKKIVEARSQSIQPHHTMT